MGIQLYFSNKIEVLAEKLAASLREEFQGSDPFIAPTVMVANPNVAKWLQLEIATHNRIAANIDYPFLERGLWDILAGFDSSEHKPVRLQPERYQFLILSVILAAGAKDPDMGFLLRYLAGADGDKAADYSRRAWQLSERLAGIFREYEYNREAMIDAWLGGNFLYKDDAKISADIKKVESSERALYLKIFGEDGVRDRLHKKTGELLLTLPQYERRIFAKRSKRPGLRQGLSPVLHLFGTSQISLFHMRLLFEIGRHLDTKLYLLNVCREFWEDVRTPQEERFRRIRLMAKSSDQSGEFLDTGPSDNKVLSLWGRPGRENLRLLGDLEEASQGKVKFTSDWVETPGKGPAKKKTVLETVQEQILNRTPSGGDGKKIGQDTTIQIAGCPSMWREVETVHNSIIQNMLADPSLKLTDIAVLVTDMASYRPIIDSIFLRSPQSVPYNLTDSVASDDSVFGKALLSMLDLATGTFTRKEVFDIIFNASFLAGARVVREDALIWARWADELNIFHNFDRSDKESCGYGASDLYTWQQGLRRLRLGRIMEPADELSAQTGDLPAYHDVVPFSDINSQDAGRVSDFCRIVETLIRRLSELAGSRLPCAEWSRAVASLMDDFIAPPADRPKEEIVAKNMRSALNEFAENDMLFAEIEKSGGVDLAFVREYIESRLARVRLDRGKYLAGGVTVSTLLPLRPIPFKIVYIMGLGEGAFPGYGDYSILDLRHQRRVLGDVSKPEANRYLFLETLVSTRSKLYLSYVSHDLQKDKEFHPCSVVNELKDYLSENVLNAPLKTLKDEFGWPDDIPLKGSSDKYLEGLDKVKGWSDILVNFSVPDRLTCLLDLQNVLSGAASGRKIEAMLDTKIRELVGDYAAKPKEEAVEESTRVRLWELRRFLENPADAAAQRHLEIYDEKAPGAVVAENEPFYSTYPSNLRFGGDILKSFTALWGKGRARDADPVSFLTDHFERYYRYCRLQGKTPEDAFGDLDRKNFKETLLDRLEGEKGIIAFLKAREEFEFCANMAIGEAYGTVGADIILPPLELEVGRGTKKGSLERLRVRLDGDLSFIWNNSGARSFDILTIADAARPSGTLSKYHLMPILFLMAVSVLRSARPDAVKGLRWFDGAPIRIFTAFTDGITGPLEFNISEKKARSYLTMLMEEFLRGDSFDNIPLEIITRSRLFKGPRPEDMKDKASSLEKEEYRDQLEEAITWEEESTRSAYASSDIVRLCDAKVPDDAYDKVFRRIAALYEGISNIAEPKHKARK